MPLFVREDVDISEVPPPTLTEAEANLHFHQWIQHDPPGRWFDADDWVPLYRCELTFPNGQKFEASEHGHYPAHDVGELVGLYNLSGTKYPWVEEWLSTGAHDYDRARRWYRVQRQEANAARLKEELRFALLNLNINKLEVIEGRRFSPEERRRLVLEFGGTLEND